MTKALLIGIVVLCSLFGAFGQLFLKIGSNPFNPLKLIFGLVLYALATIMYIIVIRYEDLSTLYPIIALSYVWVMIISIKYLHETFTYSKLIGTIMIVMAVVLIVR